MGVQGDNGEMITSWARFFYVLYSLQTPGSPQDKKKCCPLSSFTWSLHQGDQHQEWKLWLVVAATTKGNGVTNISDAAKCKHHGGNNYGLIDFSMESARSKLAQPHQEQYGRGTYKQGRTSQVDDLEAVLLLVM